METILLHTSNFSKEIVAEKIFSATDNENIFQIEKNKINYRKFAQILQNLILVDNTITNKSSKLRKIVKSEVFKDFESTIIPKLKYFINENDNLDLDGFILFVLDDYKTRVNEFLYNLIKNCLIY